MNHLSDSQLNEYLDHTLDASTRRVVESHVEICSDCRARLEELQMVFSDLRDLHEAKLLHDLTSSVMTSLPQKQPRTWTSLFAAQLGAALGMLIWLSVQAAKWVVPSLAEFPFPILHFPLSTPRFALPVSHFQLLTSHFPLPNLHSPFSILHPPSSILYFPSSIFDLQLSKFPTLQPFDTILVTVIVFVLWLVGNFSLLRNRSGVQK